MTSVKICVCVGSSCHLKGSYTVIDLLKKALREHGLEDTVTLSAAYCQNGVTIKVDDEIVTGLNADTFDSIFQEKVLDVLKPSEG